MITPADAREVVLYNIQLSRSSKDICSELTRLRRPKESKRGTLDYL